MKKFIILIPLFNDWKSVSKLLNKIDIEVKNRNIELSVIIINDASTELRSDLDLDLKKIKLIKILNMKKNTMHQRCIAAGLRYIYNNENFDHVIIMDADGEDRPEEINNFLDKAEKDPQKTITGNRFKRSEGIVFRILYEIHKLLTLVFTGKLIKFGNFSCLPKNHVKELIQKPYLWNSYSSSVVRAIKDRTFIPSTRGTRYVQPSKMNFFGLVFHSLAIISVLKREFIVRSITYFLAYLFLIFNNISILTIFPILFLLVFIFIILKISRRANMAEFEKSLDNVGSVDTL
tara:strand:+ start:474 stop:1343 length:870 start_codon:yes stop_codon:yes gene_type:complete